MKRIERNEFNYIRKSLRQFTLCSLILLEFLRSEVVDIEFHLSHGSSCLGDLFKGLALVLGISLHRLGEIRNEVGTPLISGLHVCQSCRSRFLPLDHTIIGTTCTYATQYYHRNDDEHDHITFLHIDTI